MVVVFLMKLLKKLKSKISGQRFRALRGELETKQPALVAYLPDKNQGWILYFLWRDLESQLKKYGWLRHGIAGSLDDLTDYCQDSDLYVVAMGLKFLDELLVAGFPPEKIIYYHTHVRLGRKIDNLDRLHAVLTLNRFEYELMAMRKVSTELLHVFPAGYDEELFYRDNTVSPDIDVLFVGRYRKGKNGYYHKRKRYGFQVSLANQLVAQGLNVYILGGGWDDCEYPLDRRVQCLELPHPEYGQIYRRSRLVCSIASQEGGPVSFLEGMACGCLLVSAPTGFITDLVADLNGCWMLPILSDPTLWRQRIVNILSSGSVVTDWIFMEREYYLEKARFSSLASQLLQLCWPRR